MKKIIMLFMVTLLFSCSKEETIFNPEKTSKLKLEVSAKGNPILNFENTKEFLQEYSNLAKFKSQEEFQEWIKNQGHTPLLTKSDSIFSVSDSLRILYSDALMAILNSDAQFQIGGQTIWLNGDQFYTLSEKEGGNQLKTSANAELNVIGSLQNLGEPREYNLEKYSNKSMDNANRWKTYVQKVGTKRLITELYNETISFTDGNFSSKMFLRYRMDYESCSFWRCTWKNDTSTQRRINTNLSINSIHWNRYGQDVLQTNFYAVGHYNILLAEYDHQHPYLIDTNFEVSGYISTTIVPTGYVWNLNSVSWYPDEI